MPNRGRKVIASVKLMVYRNGEFKEEYVNVECCPSNLTALTILYTNVRATLLGGDLSIEDARKELKPLSIRF